MLDEAAFGGATPVTPKFISIADPASRWTGANGGLAFFAYCTNYLIDLKHAVIMDVEATTAVRQAEVTAPSAGCSTERRSGSASGPSGSRRIPAMAMRPTLPGWSTSAASSRISRCSRRSRTRWQLRAD